MTRHKELRSRMKIPDLLFNIKKESFLTSFEIDVKLVVANVIFVVQCNFCADNIWFTGSVCTKNIFVRRFYQKGKIAFGKLRIVRHFENFETFLYKVCRELPFLFKKSERIHNNRNIFFGVIGSNAIVIVFHR